MKKARNLAIWSTLMVLATTLLILVSVASGFEYLVFGMTIVASVVSIIWVGVLLYAVEQ